ncbi:hypothetical protein FQA39_LY18170 [Lamprigera yunnana]|nr:hypothetical protein FQA39_LY18170 [Lamprigera yunnana]
MSVDKFGRLYENMRRFAAASGSSLRRPPALGFKFTPENDYDIDNRRLTNVLDPVNSSDVLNLKYYLSKKNNCSDDRLLEVGIPSGETDATNKAYVESIIRDSETSMRTYMDMLARDGHTVHYAVERNINGIIANIIPSVVKTMVLKLVRKNDMLIADLKTKFESFAPQVTSIQKEISTKIQNSIKIAVEESTKEWNITIEGLKVQLYSFE